MAENNAVLMTNSITIHRHNVGHKSNVDEFFFDSTEDMSTSLSSLTNAEESVKHSRISRSSFINRSGGWLTKCNTG